MDLTPGEKAVLAQIRVLYAASMRPDQPMKALTMQWTPTQYETYRRAYASLVAKALVHDSGGQSFRISDAGLRAIGVALPRAQPQPVRAAAQPVPQPPVKREQPRRGFLRGLFGGR